MQLVVAEKPSVARDLARVLGIRSRGDGYVENDAFAITWCVGHLVELAEPAAYDGRWKAWRLDNLPMLPDAFTLVGAKHATAQLRIVAKLLRDKRFSSVVNACDAGREGELIFRYVYQHARSRLPVKRLWISSLTDDAIRRGFASLRPGSGFDPLGDAARSRSEADWLVGMNATRAVTIRGRDGGGSALYSIGRVQTPTLAMLVERERAIEAFVPRPYWEIRGQFTTVAGERFTAMWRAGSGRLAAAALASTIVDRCKVAAAIVERVRAKTVREPPPLLFDLTSLQRTANRRFGLSAARTLEIAQALYERHKVLTYPRTDSRHLTNDDARELPALFDALAAIPAYAPFASRLVAQPPRPGRRVVDDAKVHDHHAIIPTGKHAMLDRDEQRIFDVVARRFLGAFFPDAEFAVTEAWIAVGTGDTTALPAPELEPKREPASDDTAIPILDNLPPPPDRYVARGRVRITPGWQEVAGIGSDRDGQASASALPLLAEGDSLAGAYESIAKQTTPPPPYTEATLLGAMESAGKSIDDESLRAAMKDCGLGTPATRASIIETLLKRGYIARANQHLSATAMGIGLVRALPVASLASAELTGAWEARLARIARGEDTRAAFMADIRRYVAEIVDAVRGGGPPDAPPTLRGGSARPSRDIASLALACPRCTTGTLIAGSRGWGCSRWRDGCRFVIWFVIAGTKLTATQLRDLVTRGKTRKAKFGRVVLDVHANDGAARLELVSERPTR